MGLSLNFVHLGINGVAAGIIGDYPDCSNGGRKKHPTTETVRSLSANLKFPYKRTISAPGGMGLSAKSAVPPSTNPSSVITNNPSHHVTTTNRQVSAPILKNTNKMTKEHSLSKQVSNVATVIDELECTNIAAKTSDLEEVDKETIHFLVFLFMQYLSHPDQAGKCNAHDDENSSGKNKDDQHMSGTLLGHSFGKASEKAFQNLYTLIGKKHALKIYDQFSLNTSCFWGSTRSNMTPVLQFHEILNTLINCFAFSL